MAEVSARLLPVSHLVDGIRTPGLVVSWTAQCEACDRQCETSQSKELSACSYGVNFIRISPELLLFGFLVQTASATQAQRKTLKRNPQSVIKREIFEKCVLILKSEVQTFKNARDQALQKIIEQYKRDATYKTDLLEVMKPEIRRSLAFLHDYKQFVARVTQNINVVLQTRFPNESIEAQLPKASPAEQAIYWSAKLMDDKLKNVFLLTQPERLGTLPRTQFRLHGFILKLLRIYQAAFDEKGIRVLQTGYSVGEVTASQACATIPHTFLDNALKYSLRGGQVVLNFQETSDSIEFSVTSHGPKIELDEQSQIFEPFKRGVAGMAQQEEGSGIGLYLAQLIAKDLGSEIRVRQSDIRTKFGFETTFWLVLRRSA